MAKYKPDDTEFKKIHKLHAKVIEILTDIHDGKTVMKGNLEESANDQGNRSSNIYN